MLAEPQEPLSAHVKMNRGELLNPEWVSDPDITGGFLYETTIHMFDMLRFLFGEVTALHAIGSAHEYPETDDFSVLLSFASGMHATLASSADASWLFPFERIEVFCHHSTIVTREMESLICSEGLEGRQVERSMHQLSKEEKWGYAQEDRAFVDSVSGGLPPAVTAFDGRFDLSQRSYHHRDFITQHLFAQLLDLLPEHSRVGRAAIKDHIATLYVGPEVSESRSGKDPGQLFHLDELLTGDVDRSQE